MEFSVFSFQLSVVSFHCRANSLVELCPSWARRAKPAQPKDLAKGLGRSEVSPGIASLYPSFGGRSRCVPHDRTS